MAEKARDLAEGMGFEPTVRISPYNGLAIRHSDGGDSPDNGETPSPMRVTEEREKRDNGAFGHGVAAHPGAHSDQGLTPTQIARFWSKVDVRARQLLLGVGGEHRPAWLRAIQAFVQAQPIARAPSGIRVGAWTGERRAGPALVRQHRLLQPWSPEAWRSSRQPPRPRETRSQP